MIHHGHLNALRQAKKLGDVLVVGVQGRKSHIREEGVGEGCPHDIGN